MLTLHSGLTESSARLFAATPALCVALNQDFIVVAVTDAYLRATGSSREDLIGRAFEDAFLHNPENPKLSEVQALKESLARAVRERRPDAMPVEKWIVRRTPPDGGGLEVRYWKRVNVPVIGDDGKVAALLHQVEDVTESRRHEERLRKLVERLAQAQTEASRGVIRLSSVIESSDDPVALFGDDDRLAACNTAFRTLLAPAKMGALVGRSRLELLDAWLAVCDFATAEERARFKLERMAHGESDADYRLRTRDGRALQVSEHRTPEGGAVMTVKNLGAGTLESELREARAIAEAASAAKSRFISSLSHEMRTPLNAILGFAQLLARDQKDPLSARHLRQLEYVLSGGDHMLKLIDDVLDLSQVENNHVPISNEPLDAIELVEQVRETLTPIAALAGVELNAIEAPSDRLQVLADRTRLKQILFNFGTNAVKYNRPGGWVRFHVPEASRERIRIAVSDGGIGIPAERQHAIFEPFERCGREGGAIAGSGLGLAVTKRLAELMGGTVGFRSQAGAGSEFWLDLPRHHARSESGIRRAASLAKTGEHEEEPVDRRSRAASQGGQRPKS